MRLSQLLRIDRQLLSYEDSRSMETAERLFAELGSPNSKKALFDAVEKILCDFQRSGEPYPRILLRRRIEMRKGLYEPPRRSSAQPSVETSPADKQTADLAPGVCTTCKGFGLVLLGHGPKAAAKFCPDCSGKVKVSK